MPRLKVSLGGYYQKGDYNKCKARDEVNSAGIRTRVSYEIANGLNADVNVSYDDSFDARFTAGIEYRFGSNKGKKDIDTLGVLSALSATPGSRDLRVRDRHDGLNMLCFEEQLLFWVPK